jgi:hypothetical protein
MVRPTQTKSNDTVLESPEYAKLFLFILANCYRIMIRTSHRASERFLKGSSHLMGINPVIGWAIHEILTVLVT